MKTAIIGGGYTGLVAALRLAKVGNEVTIYEKNDYLGGLASGFKIQEEYIEKTYHHLFRTDRSIINLAEELGISEKLKWIESSVAIYYQDEIFSFSSPLDLLKFKPISFIDRVRLGLITLYLQKTKNGEKFADISAYEWMKKWSGKRVTKVIWEPLLKGKFHEYYDKVSMAWLWARIHVRGNSRSGTKEELGYFEGGFQVFTDALVNKLKKLGVDIQVSSQIGQLTKHNEQFTIGNEEFDKVLFTGPSHVFSKLADELLDKEYKSKLDSINYLGAVVGVFSSDQKLGDYYWYNVNDLEKPFLIFVNHTNFIDRQNYQGKYVYYVGGYYPHDHKYFKSDDDEIYFEWFGSLKEIFPEFEQSKVNEKYLFKFKNAQHVADLNYKDKIPEYNTPVKNLYLANFSQIYPEDRGTNYAVREGEKIAEIMTQ